MRKLVYFLLLFLSLLSTVRATNYAFKRRHTPGEQAYSALWGYSPDGGSFELSYSRFRPRAFMYSLLFSPSFGKVQQTSYSRFMAGIRPQYTFWNYHRQFFVSAFFSGYTGIEFLNNKPLSVSERKILFTVGIGAELEYYINNSFSLAAQFEQDYNFLSLLGNYTYSTRFGIRYSF